MKKVSYLLMCVTLVFVVACSKKDESPEAKLKGKWEVTAAEGYMADLNKGTKYEFDEKTATVSSGIIKNEATWQLKGDTLQLNYKSMNVPFNFIYAFEGENLILKMNNNDAKYSQKFTLTKQK